MKLLRFLSIYVFLSVPAPLLLEYLADNLFDLFVLGFLPEYFDPGLVYLLFVLELRIEISLSLPGFLGHTVLVKLEFLE